MSAVNFFDGAGRAVTLEKQLGLGGEGSVYDVAGTTDLVAKVYHKPPPHHHADKLRAMVALATPKLTAITAWPTELLSVRRGGPVVGLVMKKVKGFKEIHTLYSPAQRKVTFPQADWKFLIHVASNCAAAFDTVHGSGVVVGDVNQSNMMVNKDGLVNLIDCDSAQVQVGGRIYPCEVGVPLFTPPELIGRSFRGLTRTVNHDRFGLAVLIFHLLMMGRHPFSGRYSGPGDMPIEKAIQELRFAYGRAASAVQMQPPLHSLSLLALSPQLGGLFEKAFSDQTHGANRPDASEWYKALTSFRDSQRQCSRDSGHQTPTQQAECVWCNLIKQGSPNFFISVAFTNSAGVRPGSVFVLLAVWARIDAVPRPLFRYTRPSAVSRYAPTPWPANVPSVFPPKPLAPAILTTAHVPPEPVLPLPRFRKSKVPYSPTQQTTGYAVLGLVALALPSRFLGRIILGIDVALLFATIIWWLVLEWGRRRKEDRANLLYNRERREHEQLARDQYSAWEQKLHSQMDAAKKQYQADVWNWEQRVSGIRQEAERRHAVAHATSQAVVDAERNWASRDTALTMDFDRKKSELAVARDDHERLTRGMVVDQQKLVARAREFQLTGFLQQQFIDDATISDIGAGRKATLASFGIESAHDVEESEIRKIAGFGDKLTGRLLAWRAEVEVQFRFDPTIGVPEHERRALEFKYLQLRQPIESKLLDGERKLNNLGFMGQTEFASFVGGMSARIEAMERAAADLTVIPSGVF